MGGCLRISFSCDEPRNLDSHISARFARSKYFVLVDVDDSWNVINVKTIENPIADTAGGAGVRAAQFLHNEGVNIVVAGNFGPNALTALKQLGVRAVIVTPGITVREALIIVKKEVSG